VRDLSANSACQLEALTMTSSLKNRNQYLMLRKDFSRGTFKRQNGVRTSVAHGFCASFLFLPQFVFICDLLNN